MEPIIKDDVNENMSHGTKSEPLSDWYDSDEVCQQSNDDENLLDMHQIWYSSDEIGPNKNESDEESGCEDASDGESLEEYREVVPSKFSSQEEGYQFYLDYAIRKGFSVRKDAVKYNRHDLPTYRQFCCSFAGFERPKEPRIRETRRSKRVGCPAFLTIKFDYQSSKWFFCNFIDNHNHKMASTKEEINLLRSHRKIPDDHKTQLLFLKGTGLRKYEAINIVEAEHGGPVNLPYKRKDVYNFFECGRLTKIVEGDAKTVLQKLKELQAADVDFFFDFRKDKDGHLTHLFWSYYQYSNP